MPTWALFSIWIVIFTGIVWAKQWLSHYIKIRKLIKNRRKRL